MQCISLLLVPRILTALSASLVFLSLTACGAGAGSSADTCLPSLSVIELPAATADEAYSHQMTIADVGVFDSISMVDAGTISEFVDFDEASDTLSLQASSEFIGTHTLRFRVLVGEEASEINITVEILPNTDELRIETPSLGIGHELMFFSRDIQISGGFPPYALELITGALPPGLHLDSGSVKGTPLNGSQGLYPVKLKATDSGTPPVSVVKDLELYVHRNPTPEELKLAIPDSLTIQQAGNKALQLTTVGGTAPRVFGIVPKETVSGLSVLVSGDTLEVDASDVPPGQYEYEVSVSDAEGSIATRLLTVLVVEEFGIDLAPLPLSLVVDQQTEHELRILGADAEDTEMSIVDQSGLAGTVETIAPSLPGQHWRIRVPQQAFWGTVASITFSAAGPSGQSATYTWNLSLVPKPLEVITTTLGRLATDYQPAPTQLSATGGDPLTRQWSLRHGQIGFSLSNDGVLSYPAPNAKSQGNVTLVVVCEDQFARTEKSLVAHYVAPISIGNATHEDGTFSATPTIRLATKTTPNSEVFPLTGGWGSYAMTIVSSRIAEEISWSAGVSGTEFGLYISRFNTPHNSTAFRGFDQLLTVDISCPGVAGSTKRLAVDAYIFHYNP